MITDDSANFGRLPTPQQKLLLEGLLLPDDRARVAAEVWLRTIDFDAIEQASMRLMPLFHDRMRELGVEHPLVPMMNGMKKRCWYLNQVLLHRAAEAVRLLRDAGIEAMVLKGTALSVAYYHDVTVRPMSDVDLLVHHRDAVRAAETLFAAGWCIKDERPRSAEYLGLVQRFGHAVNLEHPRGHAVDLHWDIVWFVRDREEGCWQRSVAAEIDGQPVRVPGPEDMLLHVCAHGVAWNRVSPIRWIVDAATVLRSAPAFDWDLFVESTHRMRLDYMMLQMLTYLRESFAVAVPDAVLERLASAKPGLFERMEYRQLCLPTTSKRSQVLRRLWKLPRLLRGQTLAEAARSLPEFACWALDVDRAAEVPAAVLRKLARRLRAAKAE